MPLCYLITVLIPPTSAERSDHLCINIIITYTQTYLMSLPAYPRGENGDAYIYARQLVSLVLELR